MTIDQLTTLPDYSGTIYFPVSKGGADYKARFFSTGITLSTSNVTNDDYVRSLPSGVYQVKSGTSLSPYLPTNYGTLVVFQSGGSQTGYGFALAANNNNGNLYIRTFSNSAWYTSWTQL